MTGTDDPQGEHYFTARPASAAQRRTVRVPLAGQDVEVETAGGVFSPDHVDLGTQVLLRTVPQPPAAGDLLDLGCGWGPLALTLALTSPDARVWAVDVNERALDLVRRNAAHLGLPNVVAALPDDVPDDVRFATCWSNPPVRIGKPALHDLLRRWLPRVAPGGDAWLVVGKNLGADPLQRWLTDEADLPTTREASAKGFRVLRVAP
ncbi:class I SAM-dependent methyltransferase [Cellulomonas oligotrophica]|uniref:16S RNA G1207 methylase RsmC n=1 Tax=Cellulomonas oligotrophica TaxID=931536 RepID=A0A7Y9FJ19_9CELL|nr:methyltransferase [Cellulomonas oligotrophica]NYD88200.1 16S rRNA G1207 methylase RsmC [Cellulomonas oligotrophica]GIG33937.1 16S RNA G1207 methylase RsmC [Cellulomonas oligotrophica]